MTDNKQSIRRDTCGQSGSLPVIYVPFIDMLSDLRRRTFESLQQILRYIPTNGLKIRKLKEVWSLQTPLHLIAPNMRAELVTLGPQYIHNLENNMLI